MHETLGLKSHQKYNIFLININCNEKISDEVRFGVSQNVKLNCLLFFAFPFYRLVEVERQSQNWKKQLV